jgi:hypothetical protein
MSKSKGKKSSDEENRQKLLAEIRTHLRTEYVKQLNLGKYPELKELISASPSIQTLSTKNRIITNVQMLKHTYLHSKVNNICTCFRVTSAGTSSVYAYLYSHYDPKNTKSTVTHQYFCCGGAFKSQDGEYRNAVLPWSRLGELWSLFGPVFDRVEKMVIDKIENNSITLQADFFYPSSFTESEKSFEDSINELRLAIKFYIICWLRDFTYSHTNTVENHINPAYKSIIYKIGDLPIYEALIDEFKTEKIHAVVNRVTQYFKDLDKTYVITELGCGQKIFPMTSFEAIKIDDINFSIWREIYISNLCSNLVLNFVSPSFPFINNWFFIENAHSGLFDNPSMHDKYRHSEIAQTISSQLRDSDKYNYVDRMRDHGPINSRFMRLSKKIQRSIIYADSAIKLTDLAVCVTSENVGKTFHDIPAIVANMPTYGYNKIFTDIDVWSRHIFEFLYSFYCMNTKIKILHGDLHMNNVTLYKLYNISQHTNIRNPSVIYILRDTIYRFPHYGIYSCIIDFSRSVLGDRVRVIEEYGEKYADMYFKEQKLRMMRLMFTYFSKFMERNHSEVSKIMDNNFDLAFKLLTAIDPYVICMNITSLLTYSEYVRNGYIKLHPDAIKLTTKIMNIAESIILDNFKRAINGEIKSTDDIEWPNFTLIKKYFERYEFSDIAKIKPDTYNIMDLFNENNKIQYEIEDYDTWGPLLSLDHEAKLYKKYGVSIQDLSEWMAFRNSDESSDIERLLDRYEQQEQDVINIEQWMLY